MVGTRRARIADVAREAGVSKAAVSFAFNSPERLSEDTVARIRGVATTLGYRPHPVARMLTARQTMMVGILTPQSLAHVFGNPFFALFSEGVAAVTEERGFGLLFISPLHGSLERALARATVDGVIVVGLREDDPGVEVLREARLPMVVVDVDALPLGPLSDRPPTTAPARARLKGEEAARLLLSTVAEVIARPEM